MKKTIYKGWHRPIQMPACLRNISRVYNEKSQTISVRVRFLPSCRYRLEGEDMADWNKLFGFCYGIRGIHRNSARFVWRYHPAKDRIEIATYCYVGGVREITQVMTLRLGMPYDFELVRWRNRVWFYIDGEFMDYVDAFDIGKSRLTFGCGLYFGGNCRAPKRIELIMNR